MAKVSQMRITWLFTSLVTTAFTVSSSPIDPVTDLPHTAPPTPPRPGKRPVDIPSLEDLQNGIGVGDPTEKFVEVVQMKNGKVSEKSKEHIEQYTEHHVSEYDGFGESKEQEIIEGELAYFQLLAALRADDTRAIQDALEKAATFMRETGKTLETAREEALQGRHSTPKRSSSRSRRTLINNDGALWDKCIIPYEYHPEFTGQIYVEPVMRSYEYHTGFRFVQYNASVPELYGLTHNNRIKYINSDGCWSYVGNLRGEGQSISCCSGSACMHEIGHAIGFMHEQSNPLRDNFVRIDYDSINRGYWSQYYRGSLQGSLTYGYYDPSSVMHYWSGAFGINYKGTFTVLDQENNFLVRNDDRYFYFYDQAQRSHSCLDQFCQDSKPDCKNGGYASVVGGVCSCVCPIGLDSKTLCSTLRQTDKNQISWPAGQFTILNSVAGCPDGFVAGHLYHVPPDYIWGSNPYHAKPDWSWWHATHEFCSKIEDTNTSPAAVWETGSYCIYRKGGSCPTGFKEGYIQMDDSPKTLEYDNRTSGELPDGVYGNNTRWEFCCRDDGSGQKPIRLPNSHPFILFSRDGGCQEIEGMVSSTESFNWRSDTADDYSAFGGSIPYIYKFSDTHFNLYFCYYAPILRDCGGIYEIGADDKPLRIESPNFPAYYGDYMHCTYFIKAPENSQMVIDLTTFDVPCGKGDKLEVGFNLPGHPGVHYCGDGFDKSIVTSVNYARLTLTSFSGSSGKGFSADIKLLTDSNTCFTNGDEDVSYGGKVNYTKSLEPCLAWNEVTHCRFHRFTPDTFDDDLSENYCRNTGFGTGPWCYTNAETCARDYCDVCSQLSCYDQFDDCESLISADPNFCSTNLDGQALRGCRKTCGQCPLVTKPSVADVWCEVPGMVDNVLPEPMKQGRIGDKVEYVCPLNNITRTRTCTSSGEWTDLGFVCGACPNGWGFVEGRCYKWFELYASKDEAVSTCEKMMPGSTLPTVTTQKQTDYIRRIIAIEGERVWLGLTDSAVSSKTWEDGTALEWTNWAENEPDGWGDCVEMREDGKWYNYVCSSRKSVLCHYKPSRRSTCADQIDNCDDNIRATPDLCIRQTDYARANCPLSCGLCFRDSMDKRDVRENARQKRFQTDDCGGTIFPDGKTSTATPTTSTAATTTAAPTTSTAAPTTSTSATTASTVASTTTTPNTGSSVCQNPGLSTNVAYKTTGVVGDLVVGQIFEYECKDGYALLSGDFIRACLKTGELTGSAPICAEGSLVEEPINSENIRRRSTVGSASYSYTSLNGGFNITKTGSLTKWQFYSLSNGVIVLQVWRPVVDADEKISATFVGQTIIENTGDDRIRTIEVVEKEQINVTAGDVIAVYYPSSNKAGLPYTRCDTEYEPSEGRQFRSVSLANHIDLTTSSEISFEPASVDCKTWSVNAYIK